MLEKILGMSMGTTLSDLGAIAALTSVVVQVLKKIIPSKFPTQALVIIVALFISVLATIMVYGVAIQAVGVGILSGFVSAFIAMEGFDSLKDIFGRFSGVGNLNDIVDKEEPTNYNVSDDWDDEPSGDFTDEGGED